LRRCRRVSWPGTKRYGGGTDSVGLVRYEGGKCTWLQPARTGWRCLTCGAITEDVTRHDLVWHVGRRAGRFKEGKITQFRKPEWTGQRFCWSLLAPEKGRHMWNRHVRRRLCRLKDETVLHYHVSLREGLPNNVICHIADDGRGSFWMSSYGGIFRVPKTKLNSCADAN